jgi:hypothetical protein
MADLFKRDQVNIVQPITADKCTINWGGIVMAAVQVQISYAQQVQRRRTIGNKQAVIFATYPVGQITIARLVSSEGGDLFSKPGFDACNPGDLSFNLGGCSGGGYNLNARHCVVSQFSITAEAEGLTVVDNVMIECMEITA